MYGRKTTTTCPVLELPHDGMWEIDPMHHWSRGGSRQRRHLADIYIVGPSYWAEEFLFVRWLGSSSNSECLRSMVASSFQPCQWGLGGGLREIQRLIRILISIHRYHANRNSSTLTEAPAPHPLNIPKENLMIIKSVKLAVLEPWYRYENRETVKGNSQV